MLHIFYVKSGIVITNLLRFMSTARASTMYKGNRMHAVLTVQSKLESSKIRYYKFNSYLSTGFIKKLFFVEWLRLLVSNSSDSLICARTYS